MKQTTGFYPRLKVDTTASGAVSQAGGVLLTETIAATGLGRELSAGLPEHRTEEGSGPQRAERTLAARRTTSSRCSRTARASGEESR